MRIPRFIVSTPDLIRQGIQPGASPETLIGSVVRTEKDIHHLRNVLRLKPGDTVEAFFADQGWSYAGVLEQISLQAADLRITAVIQRKRPPCVCLIAAWIKPQRAELLVEKATELGASAIYFFTAARSRTAHTRPDSANRLRRLELIRDSAVKQSGTSVMPPVFIHAELHDALHGAHGESNTTAASHEQRIVLRAPQLPDKNKQNRQNTSPIKGACNTKRTPALMQQPVPVKSLLELIKPNADFYFIVGPEGGFSEHELELVNNYGYQPATLGANVLRTETAAMIACGLVHVCTD